MPDEIRRLDWKVFGRTERYYVKQFEEETNLRATIALDASASMKYASKGNLDKFEYGSYLAASLAFLLNRQRDAVGLAIYDDKIRSFMPPRSKQSYMHEMLKVIDSTEPSGVTGTSAALDFLAERIRRRGLVVVISDFFDDPDSVLNALKHFRHRNHEVVVFQVLDPREIDFDLGRGATFKDMETSEKMITQPFHIQKSYKETMNKFVDKIRRECLLHRIDYNLANTADPFDKALKAFLAKRAKM